MAGHEREAKAVVRALKAQPGWVRPRPMRNFPAGLLIVAGVVAFTWGSSSLGVRPDRRFRGVMSASRAIDHPPGGTTLTR